MLFCSHISYFLEVQPVCLPLRIVSLGAGKLWKNVVVDFDAEEKNTPVADAQDVHALQQEIQRLAKLIEELNPRKR